MNAQDQIDRLIIVTGEEIPGQFAAVEQELKDYAARLDAMEIAVGALADAIRKVIK